jgi:hypothetical protein
MTKNSPQYAISGAVCTEDWGWFSFFVRTMECFTPGEIEVSGFYRRHLGPRMEAAGLCVQFHYNQKPGIHFKVEPPEEYRAAILRGIGDGMASRFPSFPKTGSIWITEVLADEIDSCELAFYKAARIVIEQAYALKQLA